MVVVVVAGFGAGAEVEEPLTLGNGLDVAAELDPKVPLLAPAVDEPPFFFASSSARYCLRWISKSESLRYSSSCLPRLTGACFNLGTSTLV